MVITNGVYQHYKGGLYIVTGTCLLVGEGIDDAGILSVIYYKVGNSEVTYVRKMSEFSQVINGKERFEYLGSSRK